MCDECKCDALFTVHDNFHYASVFLTLIGSL